LFGKHFVWDLKCPRNYGDNAKYEKPLRHHAPSPIVRQKQSKYVFLLAIGD